MTKRKNQTIEEEACAMLEEKHMPKFYWAEAVGQPSTYRIGHLQMEECYHMSCTLGRNQIWDT